MHITDELLKLDPSLQLHNEGAWTEPFDPLKPGFASFNDAGVEAETGEFLYALARLLKPEHALETGTHWGIGASYLGLALKANTRGHLETCEFLPENHRIAQERMNRIGLSEVVTCTLIDVARFTPEHQYGLIFLDTEPQTRFAELERFFPYLEDGGFILIHDLHRHMHQIPNEEHGFAWPYGKIPSGMHGLVKSDYLRPFHFTTPRGLTAFYKVSPKDYEWR